MDKNNLTPYTLFSITIFLLLTNNWIGWDAGVNTMSYDVRSYETVANAAPALPQTQIPYHHAQRLFLPFLAGLISKAANVPVEIVFSVLTGIFICAAIMLLHLCLQQLKLSVWHYTLCMSMFILNPYLLRFYMIVPGMLPDMVFIAGLTLTILGLTSKRSLLVFCGVLTAAAGRQTAVVMIPGLTFWLYKGTGWNEYPLKKRLMYISATVLTIVSVYMCTGTLASFFAGPSINVNHVTDLLLLLKRKVSPERMVAYFSYILTPFLVPLAVMSGINIASPKQLRVPTEFWANLLFAAGIIAQPLLSGPFSSISQGARLGLLGMPALLTAVALMLKETGFFTGKKEGIVWELLMVCLLMAGSLHYRYTNIGPSSLAQFIITQVVIAVSVCAIMYFAVKSSGPRHPER